jgi:hypothetical protein
MAWWDGACDGKQKTLFGGTVMKAFSAMVLAASLFTGLYTTGCETSHTETDKPGVFGGNKHEETTTTRNPVTGDTSVEHKSQQTP